MIRANRATCPNFFCGDRIWEKYCEECRWRAAARPPRSVDSLQDMAIDTILLVTRPSELDTMLNYTIPETLLEAFGERQRILDLHPEKSQVHRNFIASTNPTASASPSRICS